jgi:branched-chain amino acid transport system ATP-binding protein
VSAAQSNPILSATGLSAGYGKKLVISGIELAVHPGEIVGVLGHNGAGKTTLARALCGIIAPRSGQVSLLGQLITGHSPSRNVAGGLAIVPQGHGIFPTLTVSKNLRLGGLIVRDRTVLAERTDEVFDLFPILRERQKQVGGTLSGGQQQMLAIGMAMMTQPRMLVLDEPSIGLAPQLVERVMASIRAINEKYQTSILMVEQNLKHCLRTASRAIVLNRGEKVFDGPTADLADNDALLKLF